MKKDLTNNQETTSTDNAPMTDKVLENITGGSWDDDHSCTMYKCPICGEEFRVTKYSIKNAEENHRNETNPPHDQPFVPSDPSF